MNTPFVNDMFSVSFQAFNNLYPDKNVFCQWVPEIYTDDGEEAYGVTTFSDDGVDYVDISGNLRVQDAIEVFVHELAHVATGIENEHGKEWEDAFDYIRLEYDRISNLMFGAIEDIHE